MGQRPDGSGICLQNLSELTRAARLRRAEMEVWLSECARLAVERAGQDPLALLTPGCLSLPNVAEEEPEGVWGGEETLLYTAYARCLLAAYRERQERDLPISCILGEEERLPQGRFVYVRTPLTDRAFLHFSKGMPNATVSYADSFEEACSEVYNERRDLAILPWEDGVGEPVRKSQELAEKYELYAVAALRLPSGREGEEVTLAVLSRLPLAWGADRQMGGRLSLVLYPDREEDGDALFLAARLLGCRILRGELYRGTYDRLYGRCTLEGEGILPLLLFLTLSDKGYRVCGLYRVETEEKTEK